MLDYLHNSDKVEILLSPFPCLAGRARGLRTRTSKSHPESPWRVCGSRFSAFLAHCCRADDPSARLDALESGLSVKCVDGLTQTAAEDHFLSKLAEQLLVAALAECGFQWHELPRETQTGRQRLPDVTGTLPGVGTISLEVFQPSDESVLGVYPRAKRRH